MDNQDSNNLNFSNQSVNTMMQNTDVPVPQESPVNQEIQVPSQTQVMQEPVQQAPQNQILQTPVQNQMVQTPNQIEPMQNTNQVQNTQVPSQNQPSRSIAINNAEIERQNREILAKYYSNNSDNQNEGGNPIFALILFVLAIVHAFVVYPRVKATLIFKFALSSFKFTKLILYPYVIITIALIIIFGSRLAKKNDAFRAIVAILFVSAGVYYLYMCNRYKALVDPFVYANLSYVNNLLNEQMNEKLNELSEENMKATLVSKLNYIYKSAKNKWAAGKHKTITFSNQSATCDGSLNIDEKSYAAYSITLNNEGKVIEFLAKREGYQYSYSGANLSENEITENKIDKITGSNEITIQECKNE